MKSVDPANLAASICGSSERRHLSCAELISDDNEQFEIPSQPAKFRIAAQCQVLVIFKDIQQIKPNSRQSLITIPTKVGRSHHSLVCPIVQGHNSLLRRQTFN